MEEFGGEGYEILDKVHELVAEADQYGYDIRTKEGAHYLLTSVFVWEEHWKTQYSPAFLKRSLWREIDQLLLLDEAEIEQARQKYEQNSRRLEQQDVFLKSLVEATELANSGKLGAAREILLEGIDQADRIFENRPAAPIKSVSEKVDAIWLDLLSTQGVKFTGITQGAIPELDEATDGFQWLNLITANSGGGKTMFTFQCALEMLERHEDLCCVVISWDMEEKRLLRRLVANRTRLKMGALRKGTGEKGWTPTEEEAVKAALEEIRKLCSRMLILDRAAFPNPSKENIKRRIESYKQETGTERCVLIVDFLELLPVPAEVSPDKHDEYLIEQMRDIADWMQPDPVLCIAESNKYEQGERGSASRVKGSYRKVMRSDCVMTLNTWTDDDLVENLDVNEKNGYLSYYEKPIDFAGKEAEKRAKAKKIRKALDKQGLSPMMLKIDKARDDATRAEIMMMSHFKSNYFTPWSEEVFNANPDNNNTPTHRYRGRLRQPDVPAARDGWERSQPESVVI